MNMEQIGFGIRVITGGKQTGEKEKKNHHQKPII